MTSLDQVTADLPVKTRPMFGVADEHYALFRVGRGGGTLYSTVRVL